LPLSGFLKWRFCWHFCFFCLGRPWIEIHSHQPAHWDHRHIPPGLVQLMTIFLYWNHWDVVHYTCCITVFPFQFTPCPPYITFNHRSVCFW
jgi:hypothetical protein